MVQNSPNRQRWKFLVSSFFGSSGFDFQMMYVGMHLVGHTWFGFLFRFFFWGEIHVIGCQNNVDYKDHKQKKKEVASGLS